MITISRKRNLRAFMLVELLVVISIIALLLSVLMPSLRKAREQAQIVVCSSNIRQYNVAMGMYLIDNNNAFPHPLVCVYTRESFTSAHPAGCRWHDAGVKPNGPFWPYMANLDVHSCPTFRRIASSSANLEWHRNLNWHVDSIPIEPTFTYSMNGYLSAGDEVEDLMRLRPDYRMPKFTDVKRPSDTILMAEENFWPINKIYKVAGTVGDENWSIQGLNDMFFYAPDPRNGIGDCIATFHKARAGDLNSGKGNVVFLDGHVKLKHASESFYLSVGKLPQSR